MKKFTFIIFFLFLIYSHPVSALSINYGSILDWKGSSVLIQNYGIEKKNNFLCSINTYICKTTKLNSLNKKTSSKLSSKTLSALKKEKASHITLSPQGNLLAYYIGTNEQNDIRKFIIKNLKTKKIYTLSEKVNYWDLVNDQGKVFEFSPDNKTILYLNDLSGQLSLYRVNIKEQKEEEFIGNKLTTSAYSIDDFIFWDSNTIYYVGNTKENPYEWSLYQYSLKTNIETLIAKNVSYVDSLKKIGENIVFSVLEKEGYGPMVYNTKTKKLKSFSIPNIVHEKNLVNQKLINSDTWKGILMSPENIDVNKTYPLLIWLHGGPYRQVSYGYHPYHSYGIYDSILNILPKNDVFVLKLDYRGSSGFGRAYAESLKDSVGKGDVEDVINAIAYMKNNYKISETYLVGNSYGGYLSLKSIVENPNTFAGAFSINGVTDWESLLIKLKTSIFNVHFDGLPNPENKALYDQSSIANKINNLGNQKIIISQNQSDTTIPPWQATFLYDKLRAQDKNVTLFTYSSENHVFKYKKNISDLCIQFFKFLNKTPDPECSN